MSSVILGGKQGLMLRKHTYIHIHERKNTSVFSEVKESLILVARVTGKNQ